MAIPDLNGGSTSAPAISIDGLTKRFGSRIALDAVSLIVPRGVAFGLLGPNGAGKTTLIRAVLGLTRVTSGAVHLLGHVMPSSRAVALAQTGPSSRSRAFIRI